MSKRVLRIFSADFSSPALALGYLFGLFLPQIFGVSLLSLAPGGIVSPFISRDGGFLPTLYIQSVYPIVIFIIGFIPCARIFSATVIFIRASLASYSSLALSFSGASGGEYLLHTISSVALVTVCWAISKCASDSKNSASLYALKFLFFSGIFLIILFCRSVALAFV